ncbi:MAG: hypothetical protein ACI9UV_002585, partial [Algoriphagus sp.]
MRLLIHKGKNITVLESESKAALVISAFAISIFQ